MFVTTDSWLDNSTCKAVVDTISGIHHTRSTPVHYCIYLNDIVHVSVETMSRRPECLPVGKTLTNDQEGLNWKHTTTHKTAVICYVRTYLKLTLFRTILILVSCQVHLSIIRYNDYVLLLIRHPSPGVCAAVFSSSPCPSTRSTCPCFSPLITCCVVFPSCL